MAKRPKRLEPTSAPASETNLTQSPFAALAGLTTADAYEKIAPAPVSATAHEMAAAPDSAQPAKKRSGASAPASEPTTERRFTQKLVVRREKKGRGGKTVTRISGLPQADLPALAKRMKKSLGCGASLDGDDLILLGSLVERAASWLEAEGARRVVRAN